MKLFFRLVEKLNSHYYNKFKNKFCLMNLNVDLLNKSQRRVLISYIGINSLNEIKTATHTQIQEFSEILNYFIKNNYVIDIVPYNFDQLSKISLTYDVIFGFGLPFNYIKSKNPDVISILYLTENPPDISLRLEKERINYLYDRHHIRYPIERSGKCFLQDDLKNNSAIIYMCSPKHLHDHNCFYLSPTGFFCPSFKISFKEKNAKNFIWLGGAAFVHKGLDLLIDVFNLHPDWTLFVCGVSKNKIDSLGLKCKYSNIKFMGFLNVLSHEFTDLVNKSFYMLFPSCSEGTPTSCLTAMRYGLIPIVIKNSVYISSEAKVDYFDDYYVSTIELKIQEVIKERNFDDCCALSMSIFEYSNSQYTLKSFRHDLSNILNKVIKYN